MSAFRCTRCREPDYDLVMAGKPWCAGCALEVFGPELQAIANDISTARATAAPDTPEEDTRLAVVECGVCGGWMWAGEQERCLGCGSWDLRAVALV
jgi:hypothetical protein